MVDVKCYKAWNEIQRKEREKKNQSPLHTTWNSLTGTFVECASTFF